MMVQLGRLQGWDERCRAPPACLSNVGPMVESPPRKLRCCAELSSSSQLFVVCVVARQAAGRSTVVCVKQPQWGGKGTQCQIEQKGKRQPAAGRMNLAASRQPPGKEHDEWYRVSGARVVRYTLVLLWRSHILQQQAAAASNQARRPPPQAAAADDVSANVSESSQHPLAGGLERRHRLPKVGVRVRRSDRHPAAGRQGQQGAAAAISECSGGKHTAL